MSITPDPPAKLLCWMLPQCRLQFTSVSSTCMHSCGFEGFFIIINQFVLIYGFSITTMYSVVYAEDPLVPPLKFEPTLRSKFHSTLPVNPNQPVLGLCVILSPAIQRTLQQCPHLQWLCSLFWPFSSINEMTTPGDIFQISCQQDCSRKYFLCQRCFILRNY